MSIQVGPRTFHVTDIDREKCTRVVPMRVLSFGLFRTGTDSLTEALRILGYNEAYHGYQLMLSNPRDGEMWMRALRAKFDGIGKPFGREEWDKLLGHCQAVCDVPALCFAEELIEAYPEAKVILTVRDPVEWYESILEITTVCERHPLLYLFLPFLSAIDALCRSRFRWVLPVISRSGREILRGRLKEDGPRIYEEHYKKIEALVPPERLLHYHVREGWGPLCEFLEQPVPDVEIPRGNTKRELRLRMQGWMAFDLKECAVKVVSVVALGWLGWGVYKAGVRVVGR
ncbi:hypothetical protein N8T08_005794 [Aspergillus melleus]|uniref:Uncharacterized protein n=1 Tax=Aspergillus melleus TaxID=138277 RepID=A0ACC3B1B6_9EURO|nr:hypothetical protein N8T08_005794 [Aspergillus melleus]